MALGVLVVAVLTGATTGISTQQIRTSLPGAVNLSGVSAAEGSSLAVCRADHTHSLTGVLPIANGGTASTGSPTAGGIGYGTGSAHAYTAAGASGQVLLSTGTTTPAFSSVLTADAGSVSVTVAGYWIRLFSKLGNGSYNPIVQANDDAIIFSAGTVSTGALVIAPWSSSIGGLRMSATGTTSFTGTGSFSSMSSAPDPSTAAIEVREYLRNGMQTGAIGEAPGIGFHWGNRNWIQLVMDSTGTLGVMTSDRTAYAAFRASTIAASGDITAGGDITAYATSDRRLKTNVHPISGPLAKLAKVHGVEWEWNKASGKSGPGAGVIAQEVQAVLPTMVGTTDKGYLALKVGDQALVGLLIEAVKTQQAQIEKLQWRVEALEWRQQQ